MPMPSAENSNSESECSSGEDDRWECEKCHFYNNRFLNKCEMCGNDMQSRGGDTNGHEPTEEQKSHPQPPAREEKGQDPPTEEKWQCSKCSFLNNALLNKCEMCGNEKSNQPSAADQDRGPDPVPEYTEPTEAPTENDEPSEHKISTWECSFCHFMNPNSLDKCKYCTKRKVEPSSVVANMWICQQCTFMNASGAEVCEVCNASRGELPSAFELV